MRREAEKAALAGCQQRPEAKIREGYPDRFTFLGCNISKCKHSWLWKKIIINLKQTNNKRCYGKSDGSTLEFSSKSGWAAQQCVQARKTRLCFCFSFPPRLHQFNLSGNRLTSGSPVRVGLLPCPAWTQKQREKESSWVMQSTVV